VICTHIWYLLSYIQLFLCPYEGVPDTKLAGEVFVCDIISAALLLYVPRRHARAVLVEYDRSRPSIALAQALEAGILLFLGESSQWS